jgi:hypothetical protein
MSIGHNFEEEVRFFHFNHSAFGFFIDKSRILFVIRAFGHQILRIALERDFGIVRGRIVTQEKASMLLYYPLF